VGLVAKPAGEPAMLTSGASLDFNSDVKGGETARPQCDQAHELRRYVGPAGCEPTTP